MPVEAIDDKVMREFIPWRRDYYSKFDKLPRNAKLHPTDKTLQWDMMLGKAIVKWAHEQGLRGKKSLPTATFTPKRKRVRPAFEIPEYRSLWRTMYKRINAAKYDRTRQSRELLRDYVLILANSGMRVGEANNLKISPLKLIKRSESLLSRGPFRTGINDRDLVAPFGALH